jgi:hypothetical protein
MTTPAKFRSYSASAVFFIMALAISGLLISYLVIIHEVLPGNDAHYVYAPVVNADSTYTFVLIEQKESIPDSASKAALAKIDSEHTKSIKTKDLSRSLFTFNKNPVLLVWLMVYCIMVATALALLLPLTAVIVNMIRDFKIPSRSIIGSLVLLAIIAIALCFFSKGRSVNLLSAFGIIKEFNILFSSTVGLESLIYVTIAIGCVAVYGMIMTNLGVASLSRTVGTALESIPSRFARLKDELKFHLTAVSILIMFSVITTAFIQQAIEKVITINGFPIFPSEYVYAYGLVFTTLLAVIYLPTDYHLKTAAKQMASAIPEGEKTSAVKEKMVALGSQESGLKQLQVILSILSPILGSIFTEFVKGL